MPLIAKFLASCAFYLIYTFYYSDTSTSDVYKYFLDAKDIYEDINGGKQYLRILMGFQDAYDETILKQASFWYTSEETTIINDNRSVIRFNLLLMPISGGHIFWHFLAICLFSFSGMYAAFTALNEKGRRNLFIYIAAFFLPSVLFWSSGVIKEGLLIAFLGYFLYLVLSISKTFKFYKLVGILVCLISTLFIKFYIFPALCLFLCFYIPLELVKKQLIKTVVGTAVIASLLLFFCVSATLLFPQLPIKIYHKQKAFINLGRGGHYLKNLATGDTLYLEYVDVPIKAGSFLKITDSAKVYQLKNLIRSETIDRYRGNNDSMSLILSLKPSGSYFTIKEIEPNWQGLFTAAPEAIANSLLRPYPSDINGIPEWIAFAEMIAIFGLIIFRIANRKKFKSPNYSFIFSAVVFSLFILYISGLTTPVAGALVRYRMPALWFSCLALFSQNKKADPKGSAF